MSNVTYNKKQMRVVIRKSVIMALNFLRDKQGSGEEIFEEYKEHLYSFLIPKNGINPKDGLLEKLPEDISSYYPEWLNKKPQHPWHETIAKKVCSDLSNSQRIVLKEIINKNNKATQDDLKNALIKAGIVWNGDQTLAGIKSGLSRKCVHRYSIPYIYYWDEDTSTYSLVPEALPLIKKYI